VKCGVANHGRLVVLAWQQSSLSRKQSARTLVEITRYAETVDPRWLQQCTSNVVEIIDILSPPLLQVATHVTELRDMILEHTTPAVILQKQNEVITVSAYGMWVGLAKRRQVRCLDHNFLQKILAPCSAGFVDGS